MYMHVRGKKGRGGGEENNKAVTIISASGLKKPVVVARI